MKPETQDTVFSAGAWQDTKAEGGQMMTRLATEGMKESQIKGIVRALKKAGFDPVLRESRHLGPTITLYGADAYNLKAARREMLVGQRWEVDAPGHTAALATRGLEHDRLRAIHCALESEHLSPGSRPGENLKGPLMTLEGSDADRLADFTARAARGGFAPMKKNRESMGSKLLRNFNAAAQRVEAAAQGVVNSLKPAPKPPVHDPRHDVRFFKVPPNWPGKQQ
jgi:hypothetical protein